MPTKPNIWIVDTSVFLNVLDVPGFNQSRAAILALFEQRIQAEDSFLLPFTTILESGNHIAQINNGNQRRHFAIQFSTVVLKSLEGKLPWKPLGFPTEDLLKQWLPDFPNEAARSVGLGDYMIIKQWESQCARFSAYTVRIWSLDQDLQGYECNT
jgi:hypothetical protein